MNKVISSIVFLTIAAIPVSGQKVIDVATSKQTTICNPLDLNYRFCLNEH